MTAPIAPLALRWLDNIIHAVAQPVPRTGRDIRADGTVLPFPLTCAPLDAEEVAYAEANAARWFAEERDAALPQNGGGGVNCQPGGGGVNVVNSDNSGAVDDVEMRVALDALTSAVLDGVDAPFQSAGEGASSPVTHEELDWAAGLSEKKRKVYKWLVKNAPRVTHDLPSLSQIADAVHVSHETVRPVVKAWRAYRNLTPPLARN